MDSRIYILTHKRLTGQLSSHENEELQQLSLVSENKALSEEIAYLWNISKNYFPNKDWQKDAAKEAFLERIKQPVPKAAVAAKSVESGLNWPRIISIAVIGLLAIWAASSIFSSNKTTIKASDNIEYAEIIDGTKVWLDNGAKLTIVDDSPNSREVALQGAAVFDVQHNPNRPFKIDLGDDIFVEVIGTSFKVSSTHVGSTGKVSVREGSVKLYNSNNPDIGIILTTGQEGELSSGTSPIENKDASVFTALANSDFQPLKFNRTPLDKVFTQLGMFYGVSFSFDPEKISTCSYSGIVHNDVTLDETLEAIVEVHSNISIVPQTRSNYNISGDCE